MGPVVVSLLMAWVVSSAGVVQAQKAPPPQTIRVYVFTKPAAGQPETEASDLKERLQATQDMANWLKDKKKKTVSVVDMRDLADVSVEVVAVQHDAGMSLSERTAGYLHGPRYDTWTVRVRITAGTFANDVGHQGQFPSVAAESAAGDVERWTQRNRDQLIAARPK